MLDREDIKKDKLKILVVEDDRTVLKIYEKFLTTQGYAVTFTNTGAEAIEKIGVGHFDLICLDLKLPDMDGMDLINKIKDKVEWTPVIIVTAYPTLESSIQAINAGIVTEYIVKPFDTKELTMIVRKAIEKAQLVIENKHLVKRLDSANKALGERVEQLEIFARKLVEYKDIILKLDSDVKGLQGKLKDFEK